MMLRHCGPGAEDQCSCLGSTITNGLEKPLRALALALALSGVVFICQVSGFDKILSKFMSSQDFTCLAA